MQGASVESGTVLEHDFYSDRSGMSNNSFVSYQSINELWICEDDNPPEYSDEKRISTAFSAHPSPETAC